MNSLGETLRQAREARGLTLEDVERATRIRAKYLAALEAGEYAALPTPVQAKGFVRNYSQYVGLNPEEMLAQLDGDLARRSPRGPLAALTRPRKPARLAAPSPPGAALGRPPQIISSRPARWLSPDLIIGAVVVLAVGAFLAWGSLRLLSLTARPSEAETPLAPEATITPGQSAGVTVTSAPAISSLPTSAPTPAGPETPPPPLEFFTTVQVTITVRQRTWFRVLVDGKEAFEGIGAPGAAQTYTGNQQVEVLTGNGAGLQVEFNARDQGVLGRLGQVVDRIYTLQGPIEPSPTTAPTATSTPTPSPAPTETRTPIPSRTPTPSRTPRVTPTPSRTPTTGPTLTPSRTPTFTRTPTAAPTQTPIPTDTPPGARP